MLIKDGLYKRPGLFYMLYYRPFSYRMMLVAVIIF